ncbi:hypothetical protein QTO34_000543 [Cnephaeus nilssonii]|uniref:Uncharacterized protein n=1 Tax=Cnephaeus nilssonii TaxID=3371016 RepID=A0AA40IBR1_CNENI|nr:hypothetical protein QTO34_000543 [Eptesicus nilssonii]
MMYADHQEACAEHGGHQPQRDGGTDGAPVAVIVVSFWWYLKMLCSHLPQSRWELATAASTGPIHTRCWRQSCHSHLLPMLALLAPAAGTGLACTCCCHWTQLLHAVSGVSGAVAISTWEQRRREQVSHQTGNQGLQWEKLECQKTQETSRSARLQLLYHQLHSTYHDGWYCLGSEQTGFILQLVANVTNLNSTEHMKESTLHAICYLCQDSHTEQPQANSNESLTAIILEKKKEDPNVNMKLVATKAFLIYWSSSKQTLTKNLKGNTFSRFNVCDDKIDFAIETEEAAEQRGLRAHSKIYAKGALQLRFQFSHRHRQG